LEGWVNFGAVWDFDEADAVTCCGEGWSDGFISHSYYDDVSMYDNLLMGDFEFEED